ncbi:MAG: hypothetical protein WAM05_14310, partial [Candidatus Binataceae bacterium]
MFERVERGAAFAARRARSGGARGIAAVGGELARRDEEVVRSFFRSFFRTFFGSFFPGILGGILGGFPDIFLGGSGRLIGRRGRARWSWFIHEDDSEPCADFDKAEQFSHEQIWQKPERSLGWGKG